MSFILDALKKSESDRQRQSGPALFEVKVTPPKPRFPVWAVALAALLVINIAFGAWVLLHRAPAAAPAVVQSAPATAVPSMQTLPPPPPATAPASQLPPAPASAAPVTAPASSARVASAQAAEPVLSDGGAKAPAANPDDYAAAAPAAVAAGKVEDDGHVTRGTESGLKSYADAQSDPSLHLPALRVDLHVYAAKPDERFVLVNMHRLHEGDTMPEGVHIESITPEGVVVAYQGVKYMLEEHQ